MFPTGNPEQFPTHGPAWYRLKRTYQTNSAPESINNTTYSSLLLLSLAQLDG